jgi:hypothetical protein
MNNSAPMNRKAPAHQRGVAAVELAILLALLVALLGAPYMVARSLLQVTVAQRAVGNTARMVATYPQYLRMSTSLDIEDEAEEMVADALIAAAVVTADGDTPRVDMSCYQPLSLDCQATTVPVQLFVGVELEVLDPTAPFPIVRSYFPPVSIVAHDRYAN